MCGGLNTIPLPIGIPNSVVGLRLWTNFSPLHRLLVHLEDSREGKTAAVQWWRSRDVFFRSGGIKLRNVFCYSYCRKDATLRNFKGLSKAREYIIMYFYCPFI